MNENETHGENIAETVAKLVMEKGEIQPLTPIDGNPLTHPVLVSVPTYRHVEDVTAEFRAAYEYLKPARRQGTARLADLASFIAWANRFKGDTSVIYANPDMSDPQLTCISDYHEKGSIFIDPEYGDETARHMLHRAEYHFPVSDEWTAWMKVSKGSNGNPMPLDKDDMGEFIEAHAKDIMDPTPAILGGSYSDENEGWENRLIETAEQIEGRYGPLHQLLSMSRQFQVFETSDLKLTTNRDTGEAEIMFQSEHKDAQGQKLNIPNLIIVAIPVFRGGAPYRMPVRFRYRKNGGSVQFILSVYNPERYFEAAFEEAVTQATEATELQTFYGTPEK